MRFKKSKKERRREKLAKKVLKKLLKMPVDKFLYEFYKSRRRFCKGAETFCRSPSIPKRGGYVRY